ncbi:MAG: protein-L-isoaspartate O-methyltransferase [Rhizobiales bacterium]|nr:protein-L-isoaspartate O-methyltransferase [Hyphomicrobiales bacterium]
MAESRRAGPDRRRFLAGASAMLLAPPARANVPLPNDRRASPPMDNRAGYIGWMVKNRAEDPAFLGARYDRFRLMLERKDLWDKSAMRAYLMTPREEFVLPSSRDQAYVGHYLDIGFGVTITGPNTVCRMTNSLDIAMGEKVLEIGTGSGYQSAVLANLTDKVWSIEIIAALASRTRKLYDGLIARGYGEYRAIVTKSADGYYGWAENAPFDKMIVTCGIDHIPPPLLKQLKAGGIMVIPVGPPGAQHVLKVVKQQNADGSITVSRRDLYNGGIVNFVPFTKIEGGGIRGTHNGVPN